MSAQLCSAIPGNYSDAANRQLFFKVKAEKETVDACDVREQPKIGVPGKSCETELFFGFFFDGTRNNYEASSKSGKQNHTNIARLYDCFPGQSVPGVLPKETDWDYKQDRYSHFFRVYVPGVGTEFKQIKDSGTGLRATLGAGLGIGGAARIVWALVQAINNVHRYFHKHPLIDNDEASQLANQVEIDRNKLFQTKPGSRWAELFKQKDDKTRQTIEGMLRRLHTAVTPHWIDKMLGRPPKIDPGIVKKINISIFGFSRGAAQARGFANWLLAMCQRDAELHGRGNASMTLGGFPVDFNFMGLLDTVASIGSANTMGNQWGLGMVDGHGFWADADTSLRIPEEIPTLHLVAAHEVRRSFPLDSVSVGVNTADNCTELVFPGVHSDVGGAYAPTEQGKGLDSTGADMLSRIPLVYLYRAARLRGVPLKLELAKAEVKQRFALAPAAIAAFNAYLGQCKVQSGTLTAIMREQRRLFIQWKLLRAAHATTALETTASFARASSFDQNDLHSANIEFGEELTAFNTWRAAQGEHFQPQPQAAGFDNEHLREWEEIATWWKPNPTLAVEVTGFFDDYVHDSRAWFKFVPTGAGGSPDNEDEMHAVLRTWVAKRRAAEAERKRNPHANDGLTAEQGRAADLYALTGKIPRMDNAGRETYALARAGYLRYRKVYAGGDTVLLSSAPSLDVAHSETT